MVSSNHSVQSSIGGDSDKSNTHSSAETGDFPNSTVFVGDLSIFVTEGDLVLAFQPFGSIVDAKVMRCEETHKNLSYGFVKFSESAAAVAAMEDLNGKLLCGRPMRISWASHKMKKSAGDDISVGGGIMNKPKPSMGYRHDRESNYSIDSASIHVTFTSEQVNYYIDEEVLRSVFQQFGEVVDITIKKYDFDPANQSQRGYGFIHYPSTDEGIEAALRCTEELRNTLLGEARYKCDVSHKLMKELYDRNHPSIGSLMQRYPSFMKVIQAREGINRSRFGGGNSGGSVSHQYPTSYVQSKHGYWDNSLHSTAGGGRRGPAGPMLAPTSNPMISAIHNPYTPYPIAAHPPTFTPAFPQAMLPSESGHGLLAHSTSKSSSHDGGSMVGYFAMNSFFHGGQHPISFFPTTIAASNAANAGSTGDTATAGDTISQGFLPNNRLTTNIDSFPIDDFTMYGYIPKSDIPSNEQLMIDTAQADQPNVQAEDESKGAMTELNNQENVINHSTNLMKDTSSWSAATPFHSQQHAKTINQQSQTVPAAEVADQHASGFAATEKDRMYAIASPTWFHPWNHVMYPYSSYGSPPFSPTPFAFSPIPMIPSPTVGYMNVGNSSQHTSGNGFHGKAGRRSSKISRFSFSDKSSF